MTQVQGEQTEAAWTGGSRACSRKLCLSRSVNCPVFVALGFFAPVSTKEQWALAEVPRGPLVKGEGWGGGQQHLQDPCPRGSQGAGFSESSWGTPETNLMPGTHVGLPALGKFWTASG